MSATTSHTLLMLATLLTGLVMLGEAKVLFAGVRLAELAKNPWFTVSNRIMLGSDLLFGFILLAYMFRTASEQISPFFVMAVCFSFLVHGYREWEYLAQRENRFCIGLPQFIVNNFKLSGLLLILFASLS